MDISGLEQETQERNKTSFTNNITLNYLTNPNYHIGLAKKRKDDIILNKEEVKFYRKRILALTRDMFKGEIPSQNIKKAHDNYVSTIIEYFKMIDKRDILQNEYMNDSTNNNEINADNNLDLINEADNIREADECIMNKPIIKSTLDNFINSKQIKIQDTIPPPKKKQINLYTTELKKKGLKKKVKINK